VDEAAKDTEYTEEIEVEDLDMQDNVNED